MARKSGNLPDPASFLNDEIARITEELGSAATKLSGNNYARVKATSPVLSKLTTDIKSAFIRNMTSQVNGLQTELLNAIQTNIISDIWNWPNPINWRGARGAKGPVSAKPSSPRDIVDTGELFSKQVVQVNFLQTGFKINIRNTAKHASIVHYGGYFRPWGDMTRARQFMPGRPFIDVTLGLQTAGNVVGANSPVVIDYRRRIADIFISSLSRAISDAT